MFSYPHSKFTIQNMFDILERSILKVFSNLSCRLVASGSLFYG